MALLAPWLADFQLLAAALLVGVMFAIALLRQPAQRLAVAKSTLVALAALALLCAIPGWSLVHLLSEQPAPPPIASPAPLADIPAFAPTPAPLPVAPVVAAPSPIVTTIETAPTPPPAEPIDWPAAIVTLYAAGCALVALWLAIGGLLARRVFNQATPAPPELEQLLAQITGPVARPPQLLLSRHIAAPVAMGLRRPTILLPASVSPPSQGGSSCGAARGGIPDASIPVNSQSPLPASTFPIPHSAFASSPTQLLPILAHEWAHLEHRDLHTLAATRLLLILLWPQPLFWLLRRTIRLDQETLADAAAADRAGRLDYAQQLLAWARSANTQRPPRLAGAVGLWEGPSQLKRRIAVLLNEKFSVMRSCSAAWRRICIASLAVAAIALSLVTLQPTPVVGNDDATNVKPADNTSDNKASALTAEQPADFTIAPAGQYEEAGATEPNTYAGICVDELGQPLPGVEVSLFVYGNLEIGNPPAENVEPAAVMTTDADGRFRFEDVVKLAENHAVDAASKQIAAIAQAPGRATGGSLESISLIASRGKTSRLPLVPAASFSGRVTDVAGNPIADAVVATNWGYLIPNAGLLTRTDAEGRFQIDSMPPATPVVTASVIVTHPDYVTKFAKQASNSTEFDVKLRHGSIITGRVVYQPADRNEPRVPAAGVRVWAAGSRPVVANDEEDGQRIAVTDADGRYELRGLVGGTYAVNASAADRVTEGLAGIEVSAKSLPVEPDRTVEVPDMVLTDGAIVRMKLVDAATGKPLATAKGAHAHITPRRIENVELPHSFRIARPIDEQAKTELRLPAGRHSFFTRLPAFVSGVVWTSVSEKVTTADGEAEFVEVVEGETVEITVKMSSYSPADYHNPVSQPSPSLDLQIPSLSPYVAPQPTGVGVSGAPLPLGAVPTAPPATISAPQASVAPPAAATTGDDERQAKEAAERGSAFVKQLAHSPNLFMGFCINEAGEPLADVDVSLFVYEGATANENVESIARVRTGADGKFEFSDPIDVAKEFPNGVPADGFATAPVKIIAVVAKAPGLTTEFQNEALYQFVKRGQAAILRLKPAQKLTGRITDDKGQPIRGAVVATTLSVGGYVPGANLSARTDADGRYTIDDLPRFDADERVRELAAARERKEPWAMFTPPGPALSVQHPDFATRRVNLQLVPGELNLSLLPGSTVKGRVVTRLRGPSDESKPLANVPVWIMRTMHPIRDPNAAYGLVEQQQTTTDADGNYMFKSLPASGYAVTATAPNLTTAGATDVAVGVGQTATAPDVVLTPGAIVRVKVLDAATKQPLKLKAGQRGYILPQRLTPGVIGAPRMDSQIAAFTVDGVGEARLAPGRYGLFVSIPGEGIEPNFESHTPDGKSTVAEFKVREGETLDIDVPLIAFPLQMASGVTATVQPAVADGAAAETQAPAMGYFQSSETPADGEQPGGVPAISQPDVPAIDGSASPDAKTPATAYPAATPKTTYQPVAKGEWSLVPLEPPKHQPNALQLHIVDEKNQPLAGVETTLYSVMSPGNEAKPIKTLATDDAGNAVFADVAPADQVARFAALKAAGEFIGGSREMYLIALKHPGLATALLYQSAGEVALGGSKRTIMLRPAVKLSGRVTDPEGKPVADAVVTAGGLSGNLSIAGVNAVSTDAAGRFEFADRGPFDRAAANKDSNLMSLNFTAANSPAVQLSPVAEDPTVKNVSDLVVTHPKFAVTQVDGGNVPGETDVRMLPAASIVGRVVHSETGAPAVGAAVRAMGEPTEPPQLKREGDVTYFPVIRTHSATTTTDEQGNYRFANLPAGTYNLWVEAENPLNEPIKLAARGVAGVVAAAGAEPTPAPDCFVGPPPVVTVKLVDAVTGQPLRSDGEMVAAPMALRADNPRLQAPPHQRIRVSIDGTFSFVALPGKFRVGVEVVDKPGTDHRVLYRSPDDFHSSGSVIDLQFGDRLSIDLPVYPMARLELLRSDHAKAYQLLEEKKFDEAIAVFSKMIAEWPDAHEPLSSRCFAYRRAGRYAEAIADAEAMLKRFPDNAWSKHILADLLASSPVEGTRDGKRALQFAEEVVAIAKADASYPPSIARYLELVAAAHAELGDFAKAIAVQEEAIKLAPSGKPKESQDRLELYRAGKPFHLKASPTAAPAKAPADQGAANARRLAPLIFKAVEPPPVSPTLQSNVGRAPAQSADIQAVSIIDRTKPLSYSMGGLEPEPSPLEFKSATLGDAVK